MKKLLSLLIFMLLFYEYSIACICVGRSLTRQYLAADLIFVGKYCHELENFQPHTFRRYYSFSVDKRIKGESKDTVIIESSGSDCQIYFVDNETYLVYAHKTATGYETDGCTRTALLRNSEIDSMFFDKLPHILSKSSLMGEIEYWRDHSSTIKMTQLKITISNKDNSYTSLSNEHGIYLFYDIKPGEYEISLNIADSLYLSEHRKSIRIDSSQCEVHDIFVEPNTMISGRIIYQDGSQANDIYLSLLRTDSESKPDNYGRYEESSTYSNNMGYFEFDKGIRLGKYILAVNYNGPTVDRPYPTIYYPGTDSISQATIFEIGTSVAQKEFTFAIPKVVLPKYTIKGHCYFKDDIPADSIFIDFKLGMKDIDDNITVITDKRGAFSFEVVKDQRIWVGTYYFPVETKNSIKEYNLKKYTERFGMFAWPHDTIHIINDLDKLRLLINKDSESIRKEIKRFQNENRNQQPK